MTSTVTPETGRRLAAAGFPKPAPAPGQWWSDGESLVFIFQAWIDGKHDYFVVAQTVAGGRPIIDDYFDSRDFRGLVYLPTVGDILRELPAYDMGYYTALEGKPTFVVFDHNAERVGGSYCPAESAALAWISLHGNPADLDEF